MNTSYRNFVGCFLALVLFAVPALAGEPKATPMITTYSFAGWQTAPPSLVWLPEQTANYVGGSAASVRAMEERGYVFAIVDEVPTFVTPGYIAKITARIDRDLVATIEAKVKPTAHEGVPVITTRNVFGYDLVAPSLTWDPKGVDKVTGGPRLVENMRKEGYVYLIVNTHPVFWTPVRVQRFSKRLPDSDAAVLRELMMAAMAQVASK